MSEISKNLSSSLEYLRKARGLTQDQLAKISGIPRTTLSHMESGGGNPSLKTLSKLALALGVPYEELLITPRPSCILIRNHELIKHLRSQGQVKKVELLPRPIPGLQFERLEFQNYALLVGTPHSKGTREYFTCTKGRISVTVEGDSYSLDEGDVMAFPGDRKHTYQNLEGIKSEGISIVVLHCPDEESRKKRS
ncbi:MAG: helix-turn-helix domain-containing protein [Alphaproteobacteria bacterium]|nr:helix-turn-helix domain-containing protein [Alphaproteobacteria bacterium]